MVKITFIAANGAERTVETPDGTSIMEAATGNLVPGIDGDCGGEHHLAMSLIFFQPRIKQTRSCSEFSFSRVSVFNSPFLR